MTLDAAAAGVGTVRQTWHDWETGRRVPDRTYMPRIYAFTGGVVRPDHFYDLPPIGQMALPFETAPAPLFDNDGAAECAARDAQREPERLVA